MVEFWRHAARKARVEVVRLGLTASERDIFNILQRSMRDAQVTIGVSDRQWEQAVDAVHERWHTFERASGEDGRLIADVLPMMLGTLAEEAAS